MNNMWTVETVTTPSKREVDFFTVSYTNGSTVYMVTINDIKLIPDDDYYEEHIVPIINPSTKDEFFGILPKDKIPSHIFEEDGNPKKWQRFLLFVNTNKKQVIFYESNTDKEILLEGDDYAKIITYFHDNFYTSWIFNTTNINYQVDRFKDSE